jgi:lysophospholipase L1-like esterase
MAPPAPLRLAPAALLLLAATAHAQPAPPVIERGQEDLLADMLGRGAALPGDCAWAGATVEQTRVLSWYTCAGQRVDLELRHRDDAPDATTRSAQFAFRARGIAAPPGLLDALAARFRTREAAFRWQLSTASSSPVALPSGDDRPLRALGLAVASFALLALPMRWLYRRLRRHGAAPRSRLAAVAGALLAVALAAATTAAGRAATLAFGRAALATLGRAPAAGIAAGLGAMVAWLALALGATVLTARTPAPRSLGMGLRLSLGAALYVAVDLLTTRHGPPPAHFGAVIPGYPHMVTPDSAPGRPPITYHYNARGFREPDFDLDKPAGVTRVALLGDSYVQGVGVEVPDTLSANLQPELARRLPERRFDVVNLGVPGDNLASHVDLYEAALRLDPDVVVLCLTLPNDLSRWDLQEQLRAARRPGLFGVARYLLGDAAAALWDATLLEHSITVAGLAHLERQVARLATLRAATPHPPRLIVMSFREFPAAVRSRLAPLAGARVLPELPTEQDDFFREDGHPTGAGNRKFARWIGEAVVDELRR